MAIETATVETLTAEVRVLMVGSRQITTSVAKQLDQAHLGGVDVFGRVRIGSLRDKYEDRETDSWVLGRDRFNGHLVRSAYNPRATPMYEPVGIDIEPDQSPTLCTLRDPNRNRPIYPPSWIHVPRPTGLSYDDSASHDVLIRRSMIRWCEIEHANGDRPCEVKWPDVGDRISVMVNTVVARRRWDHGAACSPLIVLAGLR